MLKVPLSTRHYLVVIFRDRIIGKNFDNQWPANSSNLTSAPFFLWLSLKREMYNENNSYKSNGQLNRAILLIHFNNFRKMILILFQLKLSSDDGSCSFNTWGINIKEKIIHINGHLKISLFDV